MALFLFFTKFSIFFTCTDDYKSDVKIKIIQKWNKDENSKHFISLPNIKMKKETIRTSEKSEFGGVFALDLEKLMEDEIPWGKMVQTLQDEEKSMLEKVESLEYSKQLDLQRADKLSENLIWWTTAEKREKSEPLSKEEIASRLQNAIRYAYDVYLHAKKDGEHCPTVSIGDYLFAARGFTCGHVDQVKVFKKIDKKVFFVFKKEEYVPVEVTMDIVNILAEAGGILPHLDYETLQNL